MDDVDKGSVKARQKVRKAAVGQAHSAVSGGTQGRWNGSFWHVLSAWGQIDVCLTFFCQGNVSEIWVSFTLF